MSINKSFIFLMALVGASYAQNAATTVQPPTTATPGLLGAIIRAPLKAAGDVVGNAISLQSDALKFGTDTTKKLTSGIIDAKQSLLNAGLGVASSATQFGTQAATKGIDMYTGLLSPIPIIGSFASLGSRLFGAGASAVNAGVQSGLASVKSLSNAKLQAIKKGVDYGTGVIQSVGDSVFEAKKSFVKKGIDAGANAAGMLDSAVQSGSNMLNSALKTLDGYVDSANSIANKAASSLQGASQPTS